MLFHHWLKPLHRSLRSGSAHARRERCSAQPRLEPLDDRIVPSTFTVTNLLDDGGDGSLRWAINQANAASDADTISFAPGLAGAIALDPTKGELDITASLTIDGPGAGSLTISGNDASRVFNISGSTTDVVIRDLTIAHGLANTTTMLGPSGPVALGGGLLNSGAHVTLSGVTLADNQAVASQTGYVQTNLVSDIPGLAQVTDPNLKNPWGISFGETGLFSISDMKTNVSTQYSVSDSGVSLAPPTIAIPTTATGLQGPTGQVHNDTSSFLVNGTPATFIYADLNGTISAWNDSAGTTAQVEASVAGAAYLGMDMASTASGDFLYAANTKQARIDVFDDSFNLISLGPNAFKDPVLPTGLVPFNVEEIDGELYVAYAPAGLPPTRQFAPEGAGAVAVFDTSGNFIKQLTSGGKLAAPWGITLAPSSFGQFGGDLLVGNFSYLDTEINAFDPVSGAYLGTLMDGAGNPLLAGDNGLWDLSFGNGGNGGRPGTLYFTTGLNSEEDGLFGAIDPSLSIAAGGAIANVAGGSLEVTSSKFSGNESAGTREAAGGAIVNDGGSSLAIAKSTFSGNQSVGGAGGTALGGAVANSIGSTVTISGSALSHNLAQGGAGGDGLGGGLWNGGTAFVLDTAISHNLALGGDGLDGGNGGNGLGGGIYNDGAASLSLQRSSITDNHANGGGAGEGGSDGEGIGGGIYNVGAFSVDEFTLNLDNHASTSNDDVFDLFG